LIDMIVYIISQEKTLADDSTPDMGYF